MPHNERKELPAETQAEQRGVAGRFKPRVSPQMREVIRIMAEEGEDLATAAQRVGIVLSSAQRAFAKVHTKSLYNQAVADIRANAAQAAYLRMNHLSKTAKSEQVKAEANKWIAGVDGIAALKRVEGRMAHHHTFGGFDFGTFGTTVEHSPDTPSGADDAQVIDDDE